ncbi:hypothetical protein L829_2326 [Mycobacteroides abscessus MAB_030201_1075]|uniref:Uncharacterized protein n=1 Tax=Mycobacteroides abscessus MAB_030201_1075 TaxID=1335410 RepID=A0A829PNK9_9MYCO|nr:hypothetical protein MA3A0930S_1387 [Mycobacteroides abscessus 3A-0930-S]ETZ88756.1 hypothetical protein L829_2326 [Mycobacteroides abscessus MAB_030201_1075]
MVGVTTPPLILMSTASAGGGVPDSVVGVSLDVPQPLQSKTAAVIVARALIILGSS